MAGKDINEVVTRFANENLSSLDQANAALTKTSDNVGKLKDSVKGFQLGIVANQIQDMAVQFEMGTPWIRILAQQLPQIGTAFGATGAVVGGVAAVFFSLLNPALKAAGIDIRNLKELSDDLNTNMENLKRSQLENLPTVEGLRVKYGELAEAVKKYNDATEKANKQLATESLKAQVDEFRKKYLIMGDDVETASKKAADAARYDMGASLQAVGTQLAYLRFTSGLTSEQLTILGKNLKQLPADANAEKILEVFTKIKQELTATGISPSQIKDFEDLYKKIDASANGVKTLNSNLNDAADTASKFNIAILGVQLDYIAKIGAAQRENRQGEVASLTAKQKIAEIDKERKKLEADGKLTALARQELTLKENLALAQSTEKQKDFNKQQSEAYKSIVLTNEGRIRQLELEGKIIALQDNMREGTATQLQYEIDILTNAKAYNDEVARLNNQLRRNEINQNAYNDAIKSAADIQQRADENADRARQKRIRDIQIQLNNELSSNIRQEEMSKKMMALEQNSLYMSTIQADARKQALQLEAKRRDDIAKISQDESLSADQKIIKQFLINDAFNTQLNYIKEMAKFREAEQKDPKAGAYTKIKEITEAMSEFKVAGMAVDSVWNNMSSAIDKFVETGKFRFKDFAVSVIMDLNKIAIKSATVGLFKSLGIGDLFKAAGGPVDANNPYIIGEAGPELFIPNTSGTIVPNNKLGGGGGVTNINISAVDALSFKQLLARDPSFLYAVTQQGARRIPA